MASRSNPESTDRFDRLKVQARALPVGPGVYRLLDHAGVILYVGKAKSLKKRVSSYLRPDPGSAKTRSLMSQVDSIEVTLTKTETEALILENNLIKHHQPRYNVLLRDDKSYPWIHVATAHAFPKLVFHRGAKRSKGRYFGPFPSAPAVRDTIQHLQKLFQLRNCEDSDFSNRSRPCLQYQIERCSAPCVGLIEPQDYARDVEHALLFLEGRNEQVVAALGDRMELASREQRFELAARFRDQISRLRESQQQQWVSRDGGDLDVIAVRAEGGHAVAAALFIRAGRVLGHRTYRPKVSEGTTEDEVAGAFLAQYYLGRELPNEILVARSFSGLDVLQEALTEAAGKRVRIRTNVRGDRKRWLEMARENADHALAVELSGAQVTQKRLAGLCQVLGIAKLERMECFDVSHTMGEATVVSCVVMDGAGERRDQYRRFNITQGGGDDYAALREALRRRYTRVIKGEVPVPDLLLIDGGRAQHGIAERVLSELGVEDVVIVGVAKGADRRPGQEQLFLSGRKAPLILPVDSPALHLVQQIRDEAHRFAITGHRGQRSRKRTQSVLESIAGLGPKRRQALLRHFGGIQAVARSGVEDLIRAPGISRELAQRIHDLFHAEDVGSES